MDCVSQTIWHELGQTLSLRGRRSRNKVSVGEPAEGSFTITIFFVCEKAVYVCIDFFGRIDSGDSGW